MAENSFFFNSVNGDRIYQADDFARYFRKFIQNGFYTGGGNLEVSTDGTGMTTKLADGSAHIDGYMYENTSEIIFNHALADPAKDRIDLIILRLDKTQGERSIKARLLQGIPGEPAPALTNNDYVKEMTVAEVRILAGKSFIEAEQIEDKRGILIRAINNSGLLPINSRNNDSTPDEFPLGYSAMRVNISLGFPWSFGILETVRGTGITAIQRFTTTGVSATANRIFQRQTAGGVWQEWIRIDSLAEEGGSASTGYYRRYANGDMECWIHDFPISSFISTSFLRGTWNLPSMFANVNYVAPISVTGKTTGLDKTTLIYSRTKMVNSIELSASGPAKYASGDIVYADIYVKGRWR